jgi:hypothetical protein
MQRIGKRNRNNLIENGAMVLRTAMKSGFLRGFTPQIAELA